MPRWKNSPIIRDGGILLDTHTLLWYAGADPRLPATVSDLIANPAVPIVVSRVSLWKITIKDGLGKLVLPQPYGEQMQTLRAYDFQILELTDAHLSQLHALPQLPDHRGPFDRLLTAQALTGNLTLMSRDAYFARYPMPWCRCSGGKTRLRAQSEALRPPRPVLGAKTTRFGGELTLPERKISSSSANKIQSPRSLRKFWAENLLLVGRFWGCQRIK